MKRLLVGFGVTVCLIALSGCVAQAPLLSSAEYCASVERLAGDLDSVLSDTMAGERTLQESIEDVSGIATKFVKLQPKDAELQNAHLAVADVLTVFARAQESPADISIFELPQILLHAQEGTAEIIKVCQSLNKEVA